ncbi:DNA primase [Youxingia wuxianensis]|uniref:DNA primase n=1 Tax=Youxingia wuxianensis TaxID=2763678 RepID=A0A926EPW7_9FIRM|nr:DNA primase [Youxingia wuxianensis]MBC8584497.1 DNA primase [Youxingia wuxianensis]
MLSDMFLQELKNYNDIEQVISSYVPLKKRGRVFTGLCPFHSEKTPSFTVYPDSQSFYCFGCGAGGDVITFIRNIENLEYIEAVRFLAQRAGMAMPEDGADDKAARQKNRILEINRSLARFYHSCLKEPSGKVALDYLHDRGLTNATIVRFGLGYSPNSWDTGLRYLKSQGFTQQEMQAASVIAQGRNGGYYDQFRNRVMFPIIDLRGNVVGFGGRVMGDDRGPKYLNSPDTPVFKKSRNLFALNFAKSSKREGLILAEGYMDVIAVHQAGFDNAVATLGTSLTSEQSRLISQYAQNVTIAYDSDGAGQTATRRAIGLFGETGIKVRVLSMTGAKDPDEYIKKYGAERFGILIDGAANATEFEIAKLKRQYDVETADGKVGFLKEFVKLMAGVPNVIERDVYIAKTASELEVDKAAIMAQLKYELKRMAKSQQKRDSGELKVYSEIKTPSQKQDIQRARNIKYALAEDKLLAILMKNPDYYPAAAQRIKIEDFVTDRNREIGKILFQRLEAGMSIELTVLSSQLDPEQMAVVSGLVNSISGMTFSVADVYTYIDTILSYKTVKSRDEVAGMSDDDLKEYIDSLASKKK